MASITKQTWIDSWNYVQLYVEEKTADKASNTSTVKANLKVILTDRSKSHLATTYAACGVWGPNKEWGQDRELYSIDWWYGTNDLLTVEKTIDHNVDGSGSVNVSGWFGGYFNNQGIWNQWDVSGTLTLTKFDRAATINSFTGTDIKSNFNATYTTQVSGLKYKLRISIPNKVALQTYDNYTSGTNVTLSSSSINYIKEHYPSAKTIQLGGVIETWSGSTWIGDSSEIKITVNIKKPARIRISGAWKEATPYVRVNGAWKEAVPYMRVNGAWKEEN